MNLLEALKQLGIELSEEQKTKADELNENWIPKTRFDEVNQKFKEQQDIVAQRDAQIVELGKTGGDIEALQKQIADLTLANQTQATEFENKYKELNLKTSFKGAVSKAGVKDKFLNSIEGMINKEQLVFNEDGTITGYDEQIAKILEDYPEFKDEAKSLGNVGSQTGGSGVESTAAELDKINKYRRAMGLPPKENL